MNLPPFFDQEFLGNTVTQYIIAGVILLVGAVLRRLMSRIVSAILFRLTKRYTAGVTREELDNLLIHPLAVLLFLATVFLAFSVLRYPLPPDPVTHLEPWPKVAVISLFNLGMIIAIIWVVLRLVDFALLVVQRRSELLKTPGAARLDSQFLPFAKDLLKVFVIIVGALVILGKVFGVNVTALVGGLGIGGLAVAFAAKESLENLIASFTIFLDQPFGVGDLVTSGDLTGTVEKIGFRSTRLRTVEKSYVTVPNKSMIDKPLTNLSLRTARRVSITLVYTHHTSSEKLHAILGDSIAAIKAHRLVTPDVQMKFAAVTTMGKEVNVQYFIETTSYDEYLDIREELNFVIVEMTEKHDGAFAGLALGDLKEA